MSFIYICWWQSFAPHYLFNSSCLHICIYSIFSLINKSNWSVALSSTDNHIVFVAYVTYNFNFRRYVIDKNTLNRVKHPDVSCSNGLCITLITINVLLWRPYYRYIKIGDLPRTKLWYRHSVNCGDCSLAASHWYLYLVLGIFSEPI